MTITITINGSVNEIANLVDDMQMRVRDILSPPVPDDWRAENDTPD